MPRSSLVKILRQSFWAVSLALLAAPSLEASNLAIRLGLWHLTKPDYTSEPGLEVKDQKNFFYAEASLENGLGHFASLDVTFGTIFRGTTRFRSTSGNIFLGTANVLPVSLGFTLYPIPAGKIRPYIRGGGTVAIGNSNSGNFRGFDAFGNPLFDSKTRLTAGAFGSAGLSHRIMSKLNLLTEFSYHYLDFSGPVAGVSNHSGYKILIGLGINYK